MTTPNGQIPEGGRNYETTNELATIIPPSMANPDLYANAEYARGNFISNILSGFLSIGHAIGQALNDLADALFPGRAGDHPALDEIRDGQLGLISDLSEVSGYGVLYMKENRFKNRNQWVLMEFNGPLVSPPKNVDYVDNGMRLAEGTWFIDAQITHDHHVDRKTSRIRVEVTRPDGSVYSRKENYQEVQSDKYTSLAVRHSVTVPGPGYRVHVYAYYSVGSAFGIYNRLLYRGGTALTHLMVDRINLNTNEAPREEEVPTVGAGEGDDG